MELKACSFEHNFFNAILNESNVLCSIWTQGPRHPVKFVRKQPSLIYLLSLDELNYLIIIALNFINDSPLVHEVKSKSKVFFPSHNLQCFQLAGTNKKSSVFFQSVVCHSVHSSCHIQGNIRYECFHSFEGRSDM